MAENKISSCNGFRRLATNVPSPDRRRDVAMRGDQDCRNFDAVAYEMLLKLQAVHVRHLEIDNQAFGKPVWQRREKLLSRPVCPSTKSVRTQQPAQGLEHGRIIVHNGNRGGSFRHETILRVVPLARRVGPWANRYVFRYFEDLSFSAMRTRSATVRMPSFSIIRLR